MSYEPFLFNVQSNPPPFDLSSFTYSSVGNAEFGRTDKHDCLFYFSRGPNPLAFAHFFSRTLIFRPTDFGEPRVQEIPNDKTQIQTSYMH